MLKKAQLQQPEQARELMSERVHVTVHCFFQSHQFSCGETNHFGGNLRRDVRAPTLRNFGSNQSQMQMLCQPRSQRKSGGEVTSEGVGFTDPSGTNLAWARSKSSFFNYLSSSRASNTLSISKSGYLDTFHTYHRGLPTQIAWSGYIERVFRQEEKQSSASHRPMTQ